MTSLRWQNDEVAYVTGDISSIGPEELRLLKQKAASNPRKRARICAHADVHSSVHEMIIVHAKDTYVRPHKHLHKPESFHIIEGWMTVVVFDDSQKVVEIIPMGIGSAGRSFFYRLSSPLYHALVIETEFALFHETTSGPFVREDTVFPPWAPPDGTPEADAFVRSLNRTLHQDKTTP